MTTMNEQLTSDELRQVLADWIRPMYTRERRKIAGLFEAVIARAEAAEARAYQRLEDALFAEQRATDADIRAEETDADASRLRLELAAAKLGISAMAARVAELESQLAAQGWRDFTEHPPIGELIQIVTVIDAVREEPDGLYRIGHTSEWQTWRPAPQETE
jgi:hypothetical protein